MARYIGKMPALLRGEKAVTNRINDDGSRRVKNIAAVLYLLVLAFVVGGSYINQRHNEAVSVRESNKAGLAQ